MGDIPAQTRGPLWSIDARRENMMALWAVRHIYDFDVVSLRETFRSFWFCQGRQNIHRRRFFEHTESRSKIRMDKKQKVMSLLCSCSILQQESLQEAHQGLLGKKSWSHCLTHECYAAWLLRASMRLSPESLRRKRQGTYYRGREQGKAMCKMISSHDIQTHWYFGSSA